MKRRLNFEEVSKLFPARRVFETQDHFLVKHQGESGSNITFVLDKRFELDGNGNPINPLNCYIRDHEMINSINIDFGGDAAFLFGDYWSSKEIGDACFTLKNPMDAKHVLVRVKWNRNSVCYHDPNFEINGVEYFYRSSNNDGTAGHDYWILPVGFRYIWCVKELGENIDPNNTPSSNPRINLIREKCAELHKKTYEQNDKAYKALLREKAQNNNLKEFKEQPQKEMNSVSLEFEPNT